MRFFKEHNIESQEIEDLKQIHGILPSKEEQDRLWEIFVESRRPVPHN